MLSRSSGDRATLQCSVQRTSVGETEVAKALAATLGVLLKYQDDLARISGQTARGLVDTARAGR
jgi:hypothetical protein